MDYSFFDALIDSAIVINSDREIVYCNEAAASLCESSVRRLTKGKRIYEVIEFDDTDLFLMPEGNKGQKDTFPLSEMKYKLPSGKDGKLQISIQPFTDIQNEPRWAIVIREVSLEEILHAKNQERLKQLEEYSKNLEKMVEERTVELAQANRMLSAIMDSLGQGFLTFDEKGICSNIYTKACEVILESTPSGKNVQEVLNINEKEIETFNMWQKAIFSEQLPFDSLKALGPSLYAHSENKHITLDFYPIRNDEEKINNIVLVATDKTSEYEANQALEKEKKYAQMVLKLVTSKKQFAQFLNNAKKMIAEVIVLAESTENFDHEQAFRLLHTLEGEAATYSANEIWQASRVAQEAIEPLKQGWESDTSKIIPEFQKSMQILNETYLAFIETNSELFQLVGVGHENKLEINIIEIYALIEYLRSQGIADFALQEISDTLLRQSLVENFKHFNDVIKAVAEKQNKEVHTIQFTGDVKVYTDKYSGLLSSFIHAFRNAVDHGIEPSADREMAGKSSSGTIEVIFKETESNNQNWIHIEVKDDGQGIHPEIIKKKLEGRPDIQNLEEMSDEQVIQYVFDSGLSSRDEIGEFSGRGIGLNAVRDEAIKLGGKAWVESKVGQGTTLKVMIPDFTPELTVKASA